MPGMDAYTFGGIGVGPIVVDEEGLVRGDTGLFQCRAVDGGIGLAQVHGVGVEATVEIALEGAVDGVFAVETLDEVLPVGQVGVAEQVDPVTALAQAVEQFEPAPVVGQQQGVPGVEDLLGAGNGLAGGHVVLEAFDELSGGDFPEFEVKENTGVMGVYLFGFETAESERPEGVDGEREDEVEQDASEGEEQVAGSGCYGGFELHGRVVLGWFRVFWAGRVQAVLWRSTGRPIWKIAGKSIFLQTYSQIPFCWDV